jgi:threonine aldolase
VVFLDPTLGARGAYVRKTVTQLPSKMRFVAAQFNALLEGDLWLDLARHSNKMAADLHSACRGIDGVDVGTPPVVNSVFPIMAKPAIEALRAWSFFWDWDVARDQVRWMTAWDTTAEDLDRFVAGVSTVVA